MKFLHEWSDEDTAAALEGIGRTLHGVGNEEQEHIEKGRITIGCRRRMTASEVAQLPRRVIETAPIFQPTNNAVLISK